MAGVTLVFYALLLLAAAAIGVRREADMATAPSWSVLHLVVALALAIGLIRGEKWSWWGALALAILALVFLGPLILALVGGPGVTLLLPRIDLILVVAQALVLCLLLALLFQIRRIGAGNTHALT